MIKAAPHFSLGPTSLVQVSPTQLGAPAKDLGYARIQRLRRSVRQAHDPLFSSPIPEAESANHDSAQATAYALRALAQP